MDVSKIHEGDSNFQDYTSIVKWVSGGAECDNY